MNKLGLYRRNVVTDKDGFLQNSILGFMTLIMMMLNLKVNYFWTKTFDGTNYLDTRNSVIWHWIKISFVLAIDYNSLLKITANSVLCSVVNKVSGTNWIQATIITVVFKWNGEANHNLI